MGELTTKKLNMIKRLLCKIILERIYANICVGLPGTVSALSIKQKGVI